MNFIKTQIFSVMLATSSCIAAPTMITVGLGTDSPADIANGGTFAMGDPANTDLRGALNQINISPNADGYIIQFASTITSPIELGAMLPILNLVQPYPLTIDGGSNFITIDGQDTYRGLFAHQGNITLKNLRIQNVFASGGNGGFPGGGAGMGAGAALFVNADADVVLSNVSMNSSRSVGGNGALNDLMAVTGAGGGGGLGGNGGDATENNNAFGGGGGFGGNVADVELSLSSGGGGINCGTNHTGLGGGEAFAAEPGGGIGGASAGSGTDNTNPGGLYGGGGGRGENPNQAAGGGGIGGSPGVGNEFGGDGGVFGGGGGGASGGDGGFGGGGAGAGGSPGISGSGGFGGGGGSNIAIDSGGNGGFGGGGGGTTNISFPGGTGGVGGGNGQEINYGGIGGGGAGFGGALFVNVPGKLTIIDSFSTQGNSTAAGTGANPGWAAGNDCFFLTGSSITLDPNGSTIVISQSIGDDSPSSFIGVQPGTTAGSAAGASITIGNPSNAAGIVQFSTSNQSTYSGATIVQHGTLIVDGSIASPSTVLSGAVLAINGSTSGSINVLSNGRLQGIGTITNGVQINSGGSIHAGNSIGTLSLQNLTLSNNANLEIDIDLSSNSSLSSLYQISGSVALNNATLALFFEAQNGPLTSHLYRFIQSVGAISGQLNPTIANRPLGYAATIHYLPNAVELELIPFIDLLEAGAFLSGNAKTVFDYLLFFTEVPLLQSIFDDLISLSPDQLAEALNSISPSRSAASTYFTNQMAFGVFDLSLTRLQQGRIFYRLAHGKTSETLSANLETKNQTLVALASREPSEMLPADFVSKSINNSQDEDFQKPAGSVREAAAKRENYAVWASGFGDFLSQKGQHSNPKIKDTASGAVVGFDYFGSRNGFFTISTGYIHNDITTPQHVYSATSNGAIVSALGTGYIGMGYLEIGLLGGYQRFDTKRPISIPGPSPFNETAKGSFNDWIVMPHFSGGYDWMVNNWAIIEPFGSLDWAVNFQRPYKETGASPLNMSIKGQNPSILRSQAGMNIYETWDLKKHMILFKQALSYVNKVFFQTDVKASLALPVATIPVGAPSSFTVLAYDRTLNLGAVDVELFYKHKKSGFFCSANYYGEFSSSYRANDISGMIGVFF